MSQGITIKGKTTTGQSVEVLVDDQGRVVLGSGSGGSGGLTGTATDTTRTLTSSATSYQIPATPPTASYLLLLYNGSDSDMFITFTSAVAGGIKLAAGTSLTIDLGANQAVYAYCASAGKVLNVSYKAY